VPKSLIVFFSQGGSTRRVAAAIAGGLLAANYGVDLYSIKDERLPDPRNYDLFGIGFPAHYFRAPFNVTDYLKSLPQLAGLPVFVFVMHGAYCGDAGNVVRSVLSEKGALDIGYYRCRGADYFLGYLKQGCLFSPDRPTADDLAEADFWGFEIAARCGGRPYAKPLQDKRPSLVYRIERFLVNRWMVTHMYSRLFRVSPKRCNACGLCVKHCPTANIRQGTRGRPVWGRNCLLCFSCEMKCPKEAISAPLTWLLFKPFMIYNTFRASRDPLLDHVRVVHNNGLTKPT
jgi:flavodoxin/ferredoxin